MEKIKKSWFKIIIILVVVIFAIFVSWVLYQSMISIPKQKIASEQKLFEYNTQELKNCNQRADDKYDYVWNKDCILEGKGEGCALSMNLAEKNNRIVNEDKNRCAELYKK
jgi:flagellar biosynthesis/type III secretory pathway M-ring protein FliF/YscJ